MRRDDGKGGATDEIHGIINAITSTRVRDDAVALMHLLEQTTGERPVAWSAGTVGFGSYHYRYASGEEGDFFKIGFAARAGGLTLYVMAGVRGFDHILDGLGRHQATKSTVKFARLSDLSQPALVQLIVESVRHLDAVEEQLGAIPRMSKIPPPSLPSPSG